jgi:hypothetical protein
VIKFFISIILISLTSQAEDCQKWFDKHHLKKGPSCFDNCSLLSLRSDEDNAACVGYCSRLCRSEYINDHPVDNIKETISRLVLYPGLTEAEKKLIVEDPKEALTVYLQKNTAEDETQTLFPNSLVNDESDAFRHILWAGLLIKELGTARAKVYLDAHESDSNNPPKEKAMDLKNNEIGVQEALKLKEKNQLNLESIERSALTLLRQKKLVVIDPQGYIPKEVSRK